MRSWHGLDFFRAPSMMSYLRTLSVNTLLARHLVAGSVVSSADDGAVLRDSRSPDVEVLRLPLVWATRGWASLEDTVTVGLEHKLGGELDDAGAGGC